MNQQERVSPGTAAPAEGSSCSHLSPWVFLVSALAVKTALMTVGLGAVASTRLCPRMLQGGTASPVDLQAKVSDAKSLGSNTEHVPHIYSASDLGCSENTYWASGRGWLAPVLPCDHSSHSLTTYSPSAPVQFTNLAKSTSSFYKGWLRPVLSSATVSVLINVMVNIDLLQKNTEDSWKCCPEGWRPFQESCYYFSDDQMPWNESQQNCSGMGSQLVVINTEAEQEFLFSSVKGLVTNTYETKYYMGLSAHKTGKWQWVDRTPYKKMATFWKPGEPNLLFAEKCAAIHVKGNTDSNTYSNWNNILCSTSCYRICELAVKFV